MSPFLLLSGGLVILLLCLLYSLAGGKAANGTLPPGPPRKPVIGNLLDWPTDGKEWETFCRWADSYGQSSTLHILQHL
jgi:hypothetical protein